MIRIALYCILGIIVLAVVAYAIYYFFIRSKYYVVKLVLNETRKFERFEIVGTNDRKKRRPITKSNEVKYLATFVAVEDFIARVNNAKIHTVYFTSRFLAEQVVTNLLKEKKLPEEPPVQKKKPSAKAPAKKPPKRRKPSD